MATDGGAAQGDGSARPSDAAAASDAGDGAAPESAATSVAFERRVLGTEFLAEGIAFGDFDRDGATDIVSGPYWYAGPDFFTTHELYPPVVFDTKGYSDHFFDFVHDFDGDGWPDVLVVGFPGQDASWYENPRGAATHWTRHLVVPRVDMESPTFTDLTGDGAPELVFSTGGRLGWAGPDPADPTLPWVFHSLTPPGPYVPFTHGMGVSDVDGDGRADVLEAVGYWSQPASLDGDPLWAFVPRLFGPGGGQMFAFDADGDGDRDVVTSLSAHGYGVAWFEQAGDAFLQHLVAGTTPADTPGGVALHEPHALQIADIDGDGLTDFVTGERFWGHVPEGDPPFDAPAKLYWFGLERRGGAATFVPHLIDDASGVGTQVTVGDVTGDGAPDVLVANKKGTFVFVQRVAADAG